MDSLHPFRKLNYISLSREMQLITQPYATDITHSQNSCPWKKNGSRVTDYSLAPRSEGREKGEERERQKKSERKKGRERERKREFAGNRAYSPGLPTHGPVRSNTAFIHLLKCDHVQGSMLPSFLRKPQGLKLVN